MRNARGLLIAGSLVLVVGVGATVARVTQPDPTATGQPARQAAATPVAAVPGGLVAPPGDATAAPDPAPGTTPRTPQNPTGAEGARAVAAARAYLARELGMADMVAGPFESTGSRTGRVGFRHKFGEGRRLLPQTGPYAVVVRLQRLPAGWWVLGVDGRSIQATSPTRLQRISSPLTVAGAADVYEGTVYVKVTQDRPGRDLVLGQGFVTGGGSGPGGFRGQISFRPPTGPAPGWVIFSEDSLDGSGGLIQAAAVRVQFAARPAPFIIDVLTNPRLSILEGGWLALPEGAGAVSLHVDATDTQRVRFLLTPTGTGTGANAKLLGEDRTPADGLSLTWRYPSDGFSAHLTVQAIGPGGSDEKVFSIAH